VGQRISITLTPSILKWSIKLKKIILISISCLSLVVAAIYFSQQPSVIPSSAITNEVAEINIEQVVSNNTVTESSKIDVSDNKVTLVNEMASEEKEVIEIDEKPAREDKKLSYIDIFNNENVDAEWSYEYTNNIQESLNELLPKYDAWIENLECKSTMCKLDISATPGNQKITTTAATVLGKLSKSEWNNGSLRISNIIAGGDLHTLEVLVGRNKDTLK